MEDGERAISSNEKLRGMTRAATPCGCSVSAMPSKRRSVVRIMGMETSRRSRYCARRAWWRSPDSLKSTARTGEAERRASSTRRAPSTPTAPDSVVRPPRSAMRNSLSQRLSRLERRDVAVDEERSGSNGLRGDGISVGQGSRDCRWQGNRSGVGKATVGVYAQGEADGNILLGAELYIFFLGSQQNIKQVLTCPGPCDRRIMRLF